MNISSEEDQVVSAIPTRHRVPKVMWKLTSFRGSTGGIKPQNKKSFMNTTLLTVIPEPSLEGD